jgi:hypothetical protein
MNRIEEIEQRCNNATPGPWANEGNGEMIVSYNPYKHGGMRIVDIRGWGHLTGCSACNFSDDKAEKIQIANAEFIAHSREDIPFLLNEIKRLQSIIVKLETRDKK